MKTQVSGRTLDLLPLGSICTLTFGNLWPKKSGGAQLRNESRRTLLSLKSECYFKHGDRQYSHTGPTHSAPRAIGSLLRFEDIWLTYKAAVFLFLALKCSLK